MEHEDQDRLVRRYLSELERSLARLPRDRRRQIRDEVEAHIQQARRELDPGDRAGVRQILDRLGDPAEIAREAGAEPGRRTWYEAMVPLLLPLGALLFLVGWVVGAAILWGSPVWGLRDKLLGTLIFPFGVVGVQFVLLAAPLRTQCVGYGPVGGRMINHCTGGFSAPLGLAIVFILIAAPFLVAIHLERVRRRA